MNQLGKVAVLVAGLALGTIASAARVELGKAGLYVTLPSNMQIQSQSQAYRTMILGQVGEDLFYAGAADNELRYDKFNIFIKPFSASLERTLNKNYDNLNILKKGIVKINGLRFWEYQITGIQRKTGLKVYSYSLTSTHKSSLVSITVVSSLNALEQNRKRIADIVGSISTKP